MTGSRGTFINIYITVGAIVASITLTCVSIEEVLERVYSMLPFKY